MRNENLEKRCDNAPRGKKAKEGCLKIGAEPVFTKKVTTATKKRPQPRWLCKNCRKKVRKVSALTGRG